MMVKIDSPQSVPDSSMKAGLKLVSLERHAGKVKPSHRTGRALFAHSNEPEFSSDGVPTNKGFELYQKDADFLLCEGRFRICWKRLPVLTGKRVLSIKEHSVRGYAATLIAVFRTRDNPYFAMSENCETVTVEVVVSLMMKPSMKSPATRSRRACDEMGELCEETSTVWVHFDACTTAPFLATYIEMLLLLPSETDAAIVTTTRAVGAVRVSLPLVAMKPDKMPDDVVPRILVGTVVELMTVPVTLSVKPIWPHGVKKVRSELKNAQRSWSDENPE